MDELSSPQDDPRRPAPGSRVQRMLPGSAATAFILLVSLAIPFKAMLGFQAAEIAIGPDRTVAMSSLPTSVIALAWVLTAAHTVLTASILLKLRDVFVEFYRREFFSLKAIASIRTIGVLLLVSSLAQAFGLTSGPAMVALLDERFGPMVPRLWQLVFDLPLDKLISSACAFLVADALRRARTLDDESRLTV